MELIYVMPESEHTIATVDDSEYELSPRDAVFISGTQVHSVCSAGAKTEALVIEMGFSLLGHDFSVFAGHKFSNSVLRFSELCSDDDTERKFLEIEHIFTKITT